MKLKHGLDVRPDINATVPQDDGGVVILLFQAVRELLFNVVKHAQVKVARVQLDRLDGELVRVVVSDDGVGFEPSRLAEKGPLESGMGLFGVRERIKLRRRQRRDRQRARTRHQRHPDGAGAERPEEYCEGRASRRRRPLHRRTLCPGAAARKIRVLLVDDHTIVRQGLAGILRQQDDIEIIAEAADGKQAVEEARRLRPDVIVMDISMPKMNGIEAARAIHAELPDIRIIGLSMHEDADGVDAMLNAGAVAVPDQGRPVRRPHRRHPRPALGGPGAATPASTPDRPSRP